MSDGILDRKVRDAGDFLNGNASLMAELANKSDTAARNRKLRKFGYEAVDVYQEVATDLLDLVTEQVQLGKTPEEGFKAVCANLLRNRALPVSDVSDPAAVSAVIGVLCANAAQRIIYRVREERPVGDGTAVTGEEVPTEQREQTPQESANGNDRQMRAVLARKAVNRGVHRADVYGVADFSRDAMRDNSTRYFAEVEQSLISDLLDSEWLPSTETGREVWNLAFKGELPVSVLFGINPDTGDFFIKEDASDKPVYPTHYPYKPLDLTQQRTPRPEVIDQEHMDHCGHCAQYGPNGSRTAEARLRHNAAEAEKKAADPTYEPKPFKAPKLPKNCPPGKVLKWRNVAVKGLLPESTSNAQNMALRRALVEFARFVRKSVNQFWLDEARKSVIQAEVRAYLEDRDGVGHGTPKVHDGPKRHKDRYVNIWPEEDDGAKDGRRWSLVDQMGDSFKLGTTGIYDAYTIESESTMPGVKRTIETMVDMLVGPVKVSNMGTMCINGETGTFVDGLTGWANWVEERNNVRKVVAFLLDNSGRICLGLAGK